jgi:aminoglycoside phosphotransferase (APT) family kinase protein
VGRERQGASKRGDAAERLGAIAERLEEVLGEPLANGVRQLSSGASRETFRLVGASHGELVAQLDRRAERVGGGRPAQAALLRAAAGVGVPVPRVVSHGVDDPVLGPSWTLVEGLPGTADPKRILAGEGVPDRGRLLDSIAAALAAVHRMPADPALAPLVEDPLALLRLQYETLGEPHPTFELAFRALAGGQPAGRRTLVHGDFRMGNLLVGEDGVTAVLDWELTHLGDPVEDLGWLCVPAWRFERPQLPAAGLGTREELIAAYERHAGVTVEPEALRWWELAGTLRWGVICVMQAFTHLSGARPSVEHAVIGRRACEVEWDLLQMLGPSGAGAPSPSGVPSAEHAVSAPSLHDRPTVLELIDAARGALGAEVLPLLEGRASFELRVALRALGIVRRELTHAADHAVLRQATLARLGAADEAELAAAIRRGAFEGREGELLAGLRTLVLAKLAVAHPGYAETTTTMPAKEGP